MRSIIQNPVTLVVALAATAALAVVGWQMSARSATHKPHAAQVASPAPVVPPAATPKPKRASKAATKHVAAHKHHPAAKHAARKHAATKPATKPAAKPVKKPAAAAPQHPSAPAKPAPAKPAPHKHAPAPTAPVKTHPVNVTGDSASATAGGVMFEFSATGHQPVAGQPWSTTVSATRAGKPLAGTVSYDALLSGQVVGKLAAHHLSNGSFSYPYKFPAAAAAAQVVIRATVNAGGVTQIFNYTIQVKTA